MPKVAWRGGARKFRPGFRCLVDEKTVEAYGGWAKLTDVQREAVRAAYERKSVIVCGAAGTGKSFLIAVLGKMGAAITATTGTAGNILPGGTTIHNRMHWCVGETLEDWKSRGKHRRFAGELVAHGGRFVIDEVSMLGHTDATQLSTMFRAAVAVIPDEVRKKLGLDPERPFGGCAMIFCGDMMQLLPVGENLKMFYHAPEVQNIFWPIAEPPTGVCVMLVRIFRQTSSLYRHLVECIRYAVMTPMAWLIAAIITRRAGLLRSSNATQLFPTNREVDAVNLDQLARFPDHFSTEFVWSAEERYGRVLRAGERVSEKDARVIDYIKYHDNKNPKPDKALVLAPNSRVIFTHNLPETDDDPAVTNGEHGTIVSVTSPNDLPTIKVRLDNGGERVVWQTKLADRKIVLKNGSVIVDELLGYPLSLGWAKTIHRAQGIGLSALIVDLSSASIYGLQSGALYTAVSRCGAMTHIAPKGLIKAALDHKWTRELQHFCTRMNFNPLTERARLVKESADMMPNITQLLFDIERIVFPAEDIITIARSLRAELNRMHAPGDSVHDAIMRECHL